MSALLPLRFGGSALLLPEIGRASHLTAAASPCTVLFKPRGGAEMGARRRFNRGRRAGRGVGTVPGYYICERGLCCYACCLVWCQRENNAHIQGLERRGGRIQGSVVAAPVLPHGGLTRTGFPMVRVVWVARLGAAMQRE